MSNHGPEIEKLMKALSEGQELGATNKFPNGKITKDDEGEIRIAVGHDTKNSVVFINFGKPTAWIGFGPSQCREIARQMINHADELERLQERKDT